MGGSQERSWDLMPPLEHFCPSGLPCEFQAGQQADSSVPWHPDTLSEDKAKPPCGIQTATEDEKRPSCLGCDSAAPQTPTDHYVHFARLLSQGRDGVSLARGGGASPQRLWAHLQSQKDSQWCQWWGALAGHMMKSDINQPDAKQCCSCHQGLAQGSLCDKEGSLSWRELYCKHGGKCKATRQTLCHSPLEMRASVLTPKGIQQIWAGTNLQPALLSNRLTESVGPSFSRCPCVVLLATVLSVGIITKAAWHQGFTIYIKISSLLLYSSNKRRVCLGFFPWNGNNKLRNRFWTVW